MELFFVFFLLEFCSKLKYDLREIEAGFILMP